MIIYVCLCVCMCAPKEKINMYRSILYDNFPRYMENFFFCIANDTNDKYWCPQGVIFILLLLLEANSRDGLNFIAKYR